MNCKIKRKSWRRLAASLLAGLCLLTGSGAALAAQAAGAAATPETAQAAPDSEAVVTPETATPEQVTEATPETAASTARFSFTVLDSDYQAPASGNIDESLVLPSRRTKPGCPPARRCRCCCRSSTPPRTAPSP